MSRCSFYLYMYNKARQHAKLCLLSLLELRRYYHIKRMAGFGSVIDLLVRIPGDRFSQVETHLLFIYVIYVVLLLLLIEFLYACFKGLAEVWPSQPSYHR